VRYADGSTRAYDHLIAFPPYVSAVRYPALRSDDRGFVPTDLADVTGRPFDQPFDSVSMCIMEMFDKATFAQVPVELTGDPAMPVRVRPDANGDYKVGTSPLWRLGKKMLGFSVPMRFAAGEPFHAGKAWQAMDVGIKAMSGMLAD
jgi:sulfide:quinone oxidoreductase